MMVTAWLGTAKLKKVIDPLAFERDSCRLMAMKDTAPVILVCFDDADERLRSVRALMPLEPASVPTVKR